MNRSAQLLLLLIILFMPTVAAFAADVSLAAAGNGKFSVNGSAMNGVAGIKLVIDYDTALLSAPVVSQGGAIAGAMLMVNTNVPGKITIAAINTAPFGASGQIVGLSFTSRGGSGGITSLKVLELIDTSGAPLQASVTSPTDTAGASGSINNPFSGWGNQTPQQQSSPTVTAPTTTATPVTASAGAPSIGTISLGNEEKPAAPAPPATPAQPPQEYRQPEPYQPPPPAARTDEPTNRPAVEKKRGEFKKISFPPVLDRFKAFTGERTLAALTALFSAPVADEAHQEPAIAVSDGTRTVRIVAALTAADDDAAPNFSASEAKIVTLKPESGKWLIELLPAPGTTTAAISILLDNRLFEVPLTLVAPVRTLTFTDKEISAFLKDSGATKPLFDLDGNGSHDYRDDYLYCGHYLLSRAPGKASAPK